MHNNIEEKRKLYDLDIIPPVDPENTGQASAQQFFTYPGPSISRGEVGTHIGLPNNLGPKS
jgi:hypothetical protein